MQEQYRMLLRLTIIVGIVYLGFRFLLPVFLPFVLAYGVAVILRKPVHFLWKKLHIKPVFGGAILLILFLVVAGGSIAYMVKLLLQQFAEFVGNYDAYAAEVDGYAETVCGRLDGWFRLDTGRSFYILSDGVDGILLFFKEELVPFLTRNSVKAAVSVTELVAAIIIIFVAVLLFLGEMVEKTKDRKKGKGMFSFLEKEWHQIRGELSDAGIAYVKTQLILIFLVSLVCTLGLCMIKNPYALLFGVGIAVFDAFPVLGSGLILMPWAVFSFIRGKAFAGAVLLTLFGMCQFLREYLEPKLLGGKMGIRPVQSLMAVYIGYELFGILGLFLGPFGVVLIKSMWQVTGTGE